MLMRRVTATWELPYDEMGPGEYCDQFKHDPVKMILAMTDEKPTHVRVSGFEIKENET